MSRLKRSDVYFGIFVILALVVLYFMNRSSVPEKKIEQIQKVYNLDSLRMVIEKNYRHELDSSNKVIEKRIAPIEKKNKEILDRINSRRDTYGPLPRF